MTARDAAPGLFNRSTVLRWTTISLLTLCNLAVLLAAGLSREHSVLGAAVSGLLFGVFQPLLTGYLVSIYSR
jgi:hypothetical protein